MNTQTALLRVKLMYCRWLKRHTLSPLNCITTFEIRLSHLNFSMLCTNDSLSRKKSSTYFFCCHKNKTECVCHQLNEFTNSAKCKVNSDNLGGLHNHPAPSLSLWLTFFLSGSSLYFLERILVRSRLLISGWSLAYLALFSMKKRKYGVKGFLGKSGCFC